jgi:alanine dehydrogenase
MRLISAKEMDGLLSMPSLMDAIDAGFRAGMNIPVRHHHAIDFPGMTRATHLIMPAWVGGAARYLGVKLVNVFPDNGKTGLPSVQGAYVLMSGGTGAPLAVMDGAQLTLWKTAAASALASRYLSRPDSRRLTMVGAGALAPFLIRAHRAARPIEHVSLWNRGRARAVSTVQALKAEGVQVQIVDDLEAAVRKADIVSCATLSGEPLVKGAWLKPGTHLDLVGAFTPAMRESDDEAVLRSRLFVDTREGSLTEGGDLVQPLKAGLIKPERIEAEFLDLCNGAIRIERKVEDITLFKSTGSAGMDLSTAIAIWKAAGGA